MSFWWILVWLQAVPSIGSTMNMKMLRSFFPEPKIMRHNRLFEHGLWETGKVNRCRKDLMQTWRKFLWSKNLKTKCLLRSLIGLKWLLLTYRNYHFEACIDFCLKSVLLNNMCRLIFNRVPRWKENEILGVPCICICPIHGFASYMVKRTLSNSVAYSLNIPLLLVRITCVLQIMNVNNLLGCSCLSNS